VSILIGISGRKRSGKDTIANYLVEHYGFQKVSFADPLKAAVYALNPIAALSPVDDTAFTPRVQSVVDVYGWEYVKDTFPEVRTLLQRMGTEVGREIFGEDFWIHQAIKQINALGNANVVVPDVRFPNEANAIWHGVGRVIRVERPRVSTSDDLHPSERALEEFAASFGEAEGFPYFDQVLENVGTVEDLHRLVDDYMKEAFDREPNR